MRHKKPDKINIIINGEVYEMPIFYVNKPVKKNKRKLFLININKFMNYSENSNY